MNKSQNLSHGTICSTSCNKCQTNEVADGCHHRVPEKLVDNSSAQIVLYTAVSYSMLLLAGKH
jgi:hypothetical protein